MFSFNENYGGIFLDDKKMSSSFLYYSARCILPPAVHECVAALTHIPLASAWWRQNATHSSEMEADRQQICFIYMFLGYLKSLPMKIGIFMITDFFFFLEHP